MLKIRLQRVGRKNDPSFRLVLTDSKNATRSGKFLEILGAYSARQGEPTIKGERIKYWMSVGAKPSDTVHNLLIKEKVITGKKVNVLPKKTVPKKEGEAVVSKTKEAEAVAVVE
jgi:small subunit ribosomal protein S16